MRQRGTLQYSRRSYRR